MNLRQLFLQRLAQTSPEPLAFPIDKAEGNYLYSGQRKILDLIGGISVCNIGHRHPAVVTAIKNQVDAYLHVMVYGEVLQSPQILYANRLCEVLGKPFETCYFTNSGSEAIECAMKLVKKVTGRKKIFSFHQSYHGSTQGALSIMGDGYWQENFKPLLPDTFSFEYNSYEILDFLDDSVAAIFIEPVQAEIGVREPDKDWLHTLVHHCNEHGILVVFDENQTGFGRAGSLFAFQSLGVIPDIIVLGKSLGAGMPLGAVISDHQRMSAFVDNPILGHITTFGGHPVSCAAGLAGLQVLLESNWVEEILEKERMMRTILIHPRINNLRTAGLWAAVFVEDSDTCLRLTQKLLDKNIFTDWFLFAPNAIRISPPLSISFEELRSACLTIVEVLDDF